MLRKKILALFFWLSWISDSWNDQFCNHTRVSHWSDTKFTALLLRKICWNKIFVCSFYRSDDSEKLKIQRRLSDKRYKRKSYFPYFGHWQLINLALFQLETRLYIYGYKTGGCTCCWGRVRKNVLFDRNFTLFDIKYNSIVLLDVISPCFGQHRAYMDEIFIYGCMFKK